MNWDIWDEGYSATGEHCGPIKVASDVEADTFVGACRGYYIPKKDSNYSERGGHPTYWGCRLFPTRKQAAASHNSWCGCGEVE